MKVFRTSVTPFVILAFVITAAVATKLSSGDVGEALQVIGDGGTPENHSKFATRAVKQASLCLNEHNAYRQANGKPPLSYSAQLETAAQNHNNVMVARNCFSHQCPGEAGFGDRISQAGYRGRSFAENIAAGYLDCKAVMQGWINSGGHRKNILGDYQHVGCAMKECSNCSYKQYWTCDFGKPM